MSIIFFTLGVSLILSLSFLLFFLWSTKKGQYDDLETPGHRMLLDDYETEKTDKNKTEDKDS